MDQQYITNEEFWDVYDHAGRTRAAIQGFISYLIHYEQAKLNKGKVTQIGEPLNPEPGTQNPEPLNLQHGFTLMETLVAMMILSIALVIICQQFSGALNAGHVSESYTRAVWHAREKMDEILLYETLSEEIQEGDFGDGYRWRYRIEPADSDSPVDLEGVATFTVTVWVSWEQGRNTKQMDISTLTLAKSPNN